MEEWIKKNKGIVIVVSIKFLCVIIAAAAYVCFGHTLIRAMYEEHAVGFLNNLIEHDGAHQLAYYYAKADHIFKLGVITFIVIGLLVISTYKLVLAHAKTMFKLLVINLSITVVFFECLTGLLFAVPALSNNLLHDFMCSLYRNGNIAMPQYEDQMAIYDNELLYTLKPNTEFVFSNPEFKTAYTTNSLGLRDDEASLHKPEIICLGDSYTMGWGVEQDETFAQRLEQMSNKKVLNAGISSYGTVREMKLLNRLDTSNLEYLIIQYDGNDYNENNTFYQMKNVLNIMSLNNYNSVKDEYSERLRYYPGKYFIFALTSIFASITNMSGEKPDHSFGVPNTAKKADESKVFINAIMHATDVDPSNIKIIMTGRKNFLDAAQSTIASGDYPLYIQNIVFVPFPDAKTQRDHYFTIDGHLNARGHNGLAYKLSNTLN
ncbi:MAG: hypothetical protein JW938_05195 [Candidatus Omnitrophica bacterium]|nr:hypothetical protein [Candidatus Omnitrophota bacterium]